MERIIKFRGKRKDNGEWVYGYYWLRPNNKHYITVIDNHFECGFEDYEVIPESVGQFTGIYDSTTFEELTEQEQKWWLVSNPKKNWRGKKIWENDLVNQSYYGINKVVWSGGWSIRGKRSQRMPMSNKLFKVIGNTIDNPELLKEGI